jgi:hypothetical protein
MTAYKYKPLRYRRRWFCYLDLLGFTNLIQTSDIESVMPIYYHVIETLANHGTYFKAKRLLYSWFSDTFIIYSGSDSYDDFHSVEYVGRRFFEELIAKKIPVRGALTHGNLYSQSKLNVFVGPALIDAYTYAECQDWLGFVLTPSVTATLKSADDLQLLSNYHVIEDASAFKKTLPGPVLGFTFKNAGSRGQNPYVTALKSMRAAAGMQHQAKYDRTLHFIDLCAKLPMTFGHQLPA